MKHKQKPKNKNIPQVKICGLTRIEDAVACADLGVNALGFVFYPKSPRYLTGAQAREITRHIPPEITTVGVFVNEPFAFIMRKADHSGLTAVQLHGQEAPELVTRLVDENLMVIKALFVGNIPSMEDVSSYHASAYLVECGKGMLPGGNALQWNWGEAKNFAQQYPLVLVGGLSPDTVSQAVGDSLPDAVDVSSGVEIGPGSRTLVK